MMMVSISTVEAVFRVPVLSVKKLRPNFPVILLTDRHPYRQASPLPDVINVIQLRRCFNYEEMSNTQATNCINVIQALQLT